MRIIMKYLQYIIEIDVTSGASWMLRQGSIDTAAGRRAAANSTTQIAEPPLLPTKVITTPPSVYLGSVHTAHFM